MSQLTVFEAIFEMRKRSAEGILEVRRARLRSRSQAADFLNGEFLEPTSIYYTHILVLRAKSVKKT